MTPDVPHIVAIAFAFCGVVAILSGLIGQPSFLKPHCRACGNDVRRHAWEDDPRCVCGASLSARHGVRWHGRERSWRAVVAGVILVAAAIGVAWKHQMLRREGLLWRDLLPVSQTLAELRSLSTSHAAIGSLLRREKARQLSTTDRRNAIEAAMSLGVATPAQRTDRLTLLLSRLVGDPQLYGPDDEALRGRVTRFLPAALPAGRSITVEFADDETVAPEPTIRWTIVPCPGWEMVSYLDEVIANDRLIRRGGVTTSSLVIDPEVVSPLPRESSVTIKVRGRLAFVPVSAHALVSKALRTGKPLPAELAYFMLPVEDTVTLSLTPPEPSATEGTP